MVRHSPPRFPRSDDDLDASMAQTMAAAQGAVASTMKNTSGGSKNRGALGSALGKSAKGALTEYKAAKTATDWKDYL